MNLYIVDIKKRQKESFNLDSLIKKDSELLSLTPYSCFLLDEINMSYGTYHDIISMQKFNIEVFNAYRQIEQIFEEYHQYGFLFRDIAIIKNYEIYYKFLSIYIKEKKQDGYKILYISDAKYELNLDTFSIDNNENSGLYYSEMIDKSINIQSINYFFYTIKKIQRVVVRLIYLENIFDKVVDKLKIEEKLNLVYDSKYFKDFWVKQNMHKIEIYPSTDEYMNFLDKIEAVLMSNTNSFISRQYQKVLNVFGDVISKSKNMHTLTPKPFVYLSNYTKYIENILCKKNNIPRIFWQHGSYMHEHVFLKFSEIIPADINFVCNEYTRECFSKIRDKNIYNVGTIYLNKTVSNKHKIFDFVYIINNMHYSWTGTYTDSENALYSMDGNNLYERHKKIITLFGTRFKDKKICIKIQPGIFIGTMMYVPFLELSKNYSNITIEFTISLLNIIEKSKYIISDYFSSEFLNRKLHYKRDIILFQGAPTPLPAETLEDMKKMFILVDTVDDLEEKVKNIEEIAKNRKRYDDIIEYYSSKKCDTKKVVTEILEKELNARR